MLWQSNMWDDYGTCGTCGAKQGEPCREPRPPHREISYAHMARRLTDEAAARARGEKK